MSIRSTPALALSHGWYKTKRGVRACAKLKEDEGKEQFLVNLLFVLRECVPAGST